MTNRLLSTKILLPLALAASAVTTAPAFAQSPASTDPSSVQAGVYNVEPNHTQVLFTVSHIGFSEFTGIFSGASGTLNIDPKSAGTSTFKISVPIASVMTTNAKLTDEIKGDKWIDAGKYPDATFVSSKVKVTGKETAEVTGDFTLHGVTKPLTLKVHFIGAGTNPLNKKFTTGFEANGEIMRSDFGVKTYLPLIGDKVHLRIAGAFEKAQ